MAKFEFEKKLVELDICNMHFEIEDNPKTNDKLVRFGEKLNNLSKITKETEDYKKFTNDLCNEFYKFLDDLLEPGASKKIFKGRRNDIEDCIALGYFLTSEIKKQKESRFNKYSKDRTYRPQDFKKKR